jgi:hypothetical protein
MAKMVAMSGPDFEEGPNSQVKSKSFLCGWVERGAALKHRELVVPVTVDQTQSSESESHFVYRYELNFLLLRFGWFDKGLNKEILSHYWLNVLLGRADSQ